MFTGNLSFRSAQNIRNEVRDYPFHYPKNERLGGGVDRLMFKVGFLDAEGAILEVVSIPAVTLTNAAERAGEIASEIDATDFFITPWPTTHLNMHDLVNAPVAH
jgi:hypothetical protein